MKVDRSALCASDERAASDMSEPWALAYFLAAHRETDTVASMMQMYVQLFCVARARDPNCPSAEPLRRAVAKLAAGTLEHREVEDCLRRLGELRSYLASIPVRELYEILGTAEMKVCIEELHEQAAQRGSVGS